ncbi:MAG: hypothetical protein JKX71_03775 [Amylibacter sp.]|nr:hypothetical protein [Amylibacter sp.]
MTLDFKGAHYPKAVIVYAMFSTSGIPWQSFNAGDGRRSKSHKVTHGSW